MKKGICNIKVDLDPRIIMMGLMECLVVCLEIKGQCTVVQMIIMRHRWIAPPAA